MATKTLLYALVARFAVAARPGRAGRQPQTGRKRDGKTTLAINLSLHRGKRGGGGTAVYDYTDEPQAGWDPRCV